jgi:putative iron-regulated protein
MFSSILTRRFATGVSFALVLGTGLFTACKDQEDNTPSTTTATLRTAAVAQYAEVAYATYQDSRDAAVALRAALQTLVTTPTAANLTAAQAAYIAARTPYEQTEAFRFYGGPIDNDADGPEGLMNGWPMDENYVDYTVGQPSAGIINGSTAITAASLGSLNGDGGETNISTGYHAIEFLLWGQDLSTTGAGARPYTDYVVGTGSTAANQARRGQYLLAVADLLIADLNQVLDQWKPNQTNYRKTFTSMPADSALLRIFTGIGEFTSGELYGERMDVAYLSHDQEDEHSCFSDQTHNDFMLGQRSINNVYFGKYTRLTGEVIDGVGLDEIVKDKSAAADANVQTALTKSAAAVQAIATRAVNVEHFDQQIQSASGLPVVKAAVDAGKEQGDFISVAAAAIGLHI